MSHGRWVPLQTAHRCCSGVLEDRGFGLSDSGTCCAAGDADSWAATAPQLLMQSLCAALRITLGWVLWGLLFQADYRKASHSWGAMLMVSKNSFLLVGKWTKMHFSLFTLSGQIRLFAPFCDVPVFFWWSTMLNGGYKSQHKGECRGCLTKKGVETEFYPLTAQKF